MPLRLSSLALAFAFVGLWGSALAVAAVPAPRTTVAAVADAIADHYFDAAKGERIAGALRAEAARGAFDRYTHPAELAAAMSERLRPEDRHFAVLHSVAAAAGAAPRAAGPGPAGGAAREAMMLGLRRGNFGFRRVEVMPGNLGYLQMGGFAPIDFQDPADPARARVDALLTLLRDTEAVIIDLRSSPGGAPAMVGYLASAFIGGDPGLFNVFHSRQGTQSEAPAVPYPGERFTQPLYVLTSSRTGSAAEAFAYTLQATKRATVVGEASAGAANPGGFLELGGGFRVFVSGGSPRHPMTGGNWEGEGVTPGHAVPAAESLEAAQRLALRGLLARAEGASTRVDQQWALEALDPPAITLSSAELEALSGRYQGLRVAVEDGALRVIRGERGGSLLQPIGVDAFAVVGDSQVRYRFVRDATKRVEAMELNAADGRRQRFARED